LDRAISPFTIEAERGSEEARWKREKQLKGKRGNVEMLGTIWGYFIKDEIVIG
jgi:hypothetical protein